MDASYKLGGLKAKIPNQQATHYDHRGILCMGKLLQNGRAFSNDGSQKDNTAHLAPCPQGGMQTLTNVGTGMTVALDVETSDTFHNSKDKIQEKDKIQFGQRCLILAGKDLGKLLTFDPGGLGRMSLDVKAPVNAKYALGTRKDEISNPGALRTSTLRTAACLLLAGRVINCVKARAQDYENIFPVRLGPASVALDPGDIFVGSQAPIF